MINPEFDLTNPSVREKFLNELNSYIVVLPTNPDREGIGKLYEILSNLSSFRDRVSYLIRLALDQRGYLNIEKMKAEEVYNREKNTQILKDEVKILKSAELRSAAVDTMLNGHITKLNDINARIELVSSFIDQAKLVYNDIMDKLKTAKAQVDIGFLLYGDIRNDNRVRL